jgi:aminoglycoside phosphotransferase family enzyme
MADPLATVAEKLAALTNPATYGAGIPDVRCIETHFAWVFLAGDDVYKLKKPIRAPDLDLSALDQRFRNCNEELRLNRELAPDVYLGLASLVRRNGRIRLGGDGEVIDWLVHLRRLPEARMLDRAMATGSVDDAAIDAAARVLIAFYQHQPPVVIPPDAYVRRIHDQIEANYAELRSPDLGLDRSQVDALAGRQLAALAAVTPMLAWRAGQRRIIEVHGDLRPEHVCLGPPATLIDRLEFSRDLRVMDPYEELAYFHVECREAGAAWVGGRFLSLYRSTTADPVPDALYLFYQSHRATTRAKIIAWHLRDPDFRARQPWPALAQRYLLGAQELLSSTPG